MDSTAVFEKEKATRQINGNLTTTPAAELAPQCDPESKHNDLDSLPPASHDSNNHDNYNDNRNDNNTTSRPPTTRRPSAASTWPTHTKRNLILTTSLTCFIIGLNSTSLLSATQPITSEFSISTHPFDNSYFLVTTWNTGAALTPLFVLPLMEDFGVRGIYYGMYGLFVVFVAVQAVARNWATLLVARVIAGSAGGVLQNCVDGIVADTWGKDVNARAVSMTVFIFGLVGGVTAGPVVGGLVVSGLGWRWILYIQLIICAAVFPLIVLTQKEPRSNRVPKGQRRKHFVAALDETVLRAVRLLFTEFVVGSFTLLSAFSFGIVFIMTQSIPQVFGELYGWPEWKTGVVQVAILIGEAIGVLLCLFQDKIVYPRFAYRGRRQSEPLPEPRLYMVVPCSFLGLTAGLFVYGWTSHETVSWVWPSVGLMLIGVGIMVIVQAVTTYVTDCYVSHASSAISGVAMGENLFAAFLPFATRDMYNNLGFQWASSLLGFVGLLLSMAPVVLVLYGQKIRAKSKYAG